MLDHELTPLQKELIKMLKWFNDFCEEKKLTYYSVGGTLLGAVRHKGFIPWDDDIDVAMPREDYNKLIKIIGNKIISHYMLETPSSPYEDYCYPYCKLYDINTTLVEHYNVPLVRGIFLDIFPLDGVGNDKKSGLKWYKSIQHSYNFYLTRVAAKRKGRSFIKNFAITVSQKIPNVVVDNVKFRNKLDKKCQKYSFNKSKWGGNLLGNWGEKEIVPLKYFGIPTKYQFEEIMLYGPENYDGYLTCIYGDWRKLPPKEKQISHHNFQKLDLSKGYMKEV